MQHYNSIDFERTWCFARCWKRTTQKYFCENLVQTTSSRQGALLYIKIPFSLNSVDTTGPHQLLQTTTNATLEQLKQW